MQKILLKKSVLMVKLTRSFFKFGKSATRELDDAWATMIKARDNWACVICGSTYKPQAHHLVPREHKQYKYEPDNGITLCLLHHKFSRVISAHNAPLAFWFWLSRYHSSFAQKAKERIIKIAESEGICLT